MSQSQGWYPDQHDPTVMRYWDGTTWIGERVWDGTQWAERAAAAAAPQAAAPPATPPPAAAVAPPGAAPAPSGAAVPAATGPTTASFKMNSASWFLVAGSVVVAISALFPWATGSDNDGFGGSVSENFDLSGSGKFVVIALMVAVIAVSWPVAQSRVLTVRRSVAQIILTAVMTLLAVLLSGSAANSAHNADLSSVTVGFGEVLCWIGLIAVWIGVILAWRRRTKSKVTTPVA